MDVHRHVSGYGRHHRLECGAVHCPQAVQGYTGGKTVIARCALSGRQCLLHAQEGINLLDEAALFRQRRHRTEIRKLVQTRQQQLPHASVGRGPPDCVRHRQRICVRSPVRLMMQVVEFGNGGVAGLQHLHVEVSGYGRHLRRFETGRKVIHDIAPTPEVAAAGLRQPGETALECVTVQVRHAGDGQARDSYVDTAGIGISHGHRIDASVAADADDHLRHHSGRQQRLVQQHSHPHPHGNGGSLEQRRQVVYTTTDKYIQAVMTAIIIHQ